MLSKAGILSNFNSAWILLIRHPALFWIPALVPFRVFAGMTVLVFIVVGVI
jgi:hypothetical protein